MAPELNSTSASSADVSHTPAAAGNVAPATKKPCPDVKTYPAGDKSAGSMLSFQAKQLLKKSNPNADAPDLRQHMRQFCLEFEDSDDTLNDLLGKGREWLSKELAKNDRKKGAKKASATKDRDRRHTPPAPAPTVKLSESEQLNGPELLKSVAAFLDRFVFFTDGRCTAFSRYGSSPHTSTKSSTTSGISFFTLRNRTAGKPACLRYWTCWYSIRAVC